MAGAPPRRIPQPALRTAAENIARTSGPPLRAPSRPAPVKPPSAPASRARAAPSPVGRTTTRATLVDRQRLDGAPPRVADASDRRRLRDGGVERADTAAIKSRPASRISRPISTTTIPPSTTATATTATSRRPSRSSPPPPPPLLPTTAPSFQSATAASLDAARQQIYLRSISAELASKDAMIAYAERELECLAREVRRERFCAVEARRRADVLKREISALDPQRVWDEDVNEEDNEGREEDGTSEVGIAADESISQSGVEHDGAEIHAHVPCSAEPLSTLPLTAHSTQCPTAQNLSEDITPASSAMRAIVEGSMVENREPAELDNTLLELANDRQSNDSLSTQRNIPATQSNAATVLLTRHALTLAAAAEQAIADALDSSTVPTSISPLQHRAQIAALEQTIANLQAERDDARRLQDAAEALMAEMRGGERKAREEVARLAARCKEREKERSSSVPRVDIVETSDVGTATDDVATPQPAPPPSVATPHTDDLNRLRAQRDHFRAESAYYKNALANHIGGTPVKKTETTPPKDPQTTPRNNCTCAQQLRVLADENRGLVSRLAWMEEQSAARRHVEEEGVRRLSGVLADENAGLVARCERLEKELEVRSTKNHPALLSEYSHVSLAAIAVAAHSRGRGAQSRVRGSATTGSRLADAKINNRPQPPVKLLGNN
ncbi:hypothetical protein BDZ88DRAFT_490110 [Geranomyces variabilis]|nr:hypothetical protein BDZ88DRAFT_490110 [Geranomyces variabilis]KAJ3136264.1 hypothetical protein HDU90_003315 [Geranomyces variabilis]